MNLSSKYTSINELSEKIKETAESIDSIECSDEKYIEITEYVSKSKLLETDFKYKEGNTIKVIYDKDNNSLRIEQDYTE